MARSAPVYCCPTGTFFLGSTGFTAFYNPATDTWTRGPNIYGGLTTADAPAAMMPNGEVLFAASPTIYQAGTDSNGFPSYTYPGPTTIVSFSPTDSTPSGQIDVTDRSYLPLMNGTKPGPASYETHMLVLPNGQIMVDTAFSDRIDLYNKGYFGSVPLPPNYSNPAWQPTITNIANNGDGSYTLSGTQLNGLSEGASYGDDAEMASNYPIITLTDPSNNVFYARTFDWSSVGVATGSTPVSTKLTLPNVAAGHLPVAGHCQRHPLGPRPVRGYGRRL